MPCCSVTQSQEVRQRAAEGKKTIRRPDLEGGQSPLIFVLMIVPHLRGSMIHLFRIVVSEP